jgi:hypothetical protein
MRRATSTMQFRARPLLLLVPTIALPLALAATCATVPSNPNAGKYPPRASGCKIHVFRGPPEVKEWDDLGVVHVDCYLDVGAVQCLQKLKMEGCRMGGDMIYDVPKKPLRPTDQGMVYTGHVAHTKATSDAGKDEEADGGAEEPTFEKSGPVEPIAPVAPVGPPPADTRTVRDGGRD